MADYSPDYLRILPSDLYDLMQSRRSLRRYESRDVPREIITQVLEAALWGPSAHNRQPWRFCVLTSPEDKHQLASKMGARLRANLEADNLAEGIIQKDVNRSYARLTNAPVLIVVCMTMADMDTYPDESRQHFEWVMATQSVAMASQNMLLMAHAEGLGACWMCAPLFCQDVVKETLQLPEDWQPQGIVAMGYPAQTREKTRDPLESKVIFR